jgi:hypothetical protein
VHIPKAKKTGFSAACAGVVIGVATMRRRFWLRQGSVRQAQRHLQQRIDYLKDERIHPRACGAAENL